MLWRRMDDGWMDEWRFVSARLGIGGFQRLIIHNSKRERWHFTVNSYSSAAVVLILQYFMLKWNLILLFFAKKTQLGQRLSGFLKALSYWGL